MAKRCEYCGRYFNPDNRVGNRQRACSRTECKRQRRIQAVKRWKQNNPSAVLNHYEDYVKPWRQSRRNEALSLKTHLHTEVKTEDTPLQGCLEIILRIPAKGKEVIRNEIWLIRVDNTTFAGYGK